MHDLNGALFLNTIFLFILLALFVPATLILHFTTIYASLWSHKPDLNIEALDLIFLLVEY